MLWLLNERMHTRDSIHYLMLSFNLIVVGVGMNPESKCDYYGVIIDCLPSACVVQRVGRCDFK